MTELNYLMRMVESIATYFDYADLRETPTITIEFLGTRDRDRFVAAMVRDITPYMAALVPPAIDPNHIISLMGVNFRLEVRK